MPKKTPARPIYCRFPGCGREADYSGEELCRGHYRQKERGIELRPLRGGRGGRLGEADMVRVSLYLDAEMVEALDAEAGLVAGMSRAAVAREVLGRWSAKQSKPLVRKKKR